MRITNEDLYTSDGPIVVQLCKQNSNVHGLENYHIYTTAIQQLLSAISISNF